MMAQTKLKYGDNLKVKLARQYKSKQKIQLVEFVYED